VAAISRIIQSTVTSLEQDIAFFGFLRQLVVCSQGSMEIEVNDVVITLAVLIFNCVQVAAESLIGPRTENIDSDRYLGLAQALYQRLGDGAVANVVFSRPGGDDQ